MSSVLCTEPVNLNFYGAYPPGTTILKVGVSGLATPTYSKSFYPVCSSIFAILKYTPYASSFLAIEWKASEALLLSSLLEIIKNRAGLLSWKILPATF